MRRGENIYKRKDGRWEGRYKKGYKSNGQIKYGYIYGKTFHEVRIKLYSMKAYYLTQQEIYGSTSIPLEEWGLSWLKDIQQEVKPSTYSSYHHKLKKYVFAFIGTQPLNELTEETGRMLVEQWMKRGLETSTMQVILRIITQCLAAAKRKDYVRENPFLTVRLPKEKKRKVHSLSKKEQRIIEETALSEKNSTGLPTYLSLHTGLRIGEIAALRWSDIDFEQNIISVNQTYQRISLEGKDRKTQLIVGSTKTASGARTIPLSPALRKLLLKHQRLTNNSFVFSTRDHPMEPRLLTYHFHRIRKKCGLEKIHFHQLRHTFATRCLEVQSDITSVSALLGHNSTKLTLDTYADSMAEQRIEVIYRMEAAIC